MGMQANPLVLGMVKFCAALSSYNGPSIFFGEMMYGDKKIRELPVSSSLSSV
jgi:hypothetical protein